MRVFWSDLNSRTLTQLPPAQQMACREPSCGQAPRLQRRCAGSRGGGAGGESTDETGQPGCRGGHELGPGGVATSDDHSSGLLSIDFPQRCLQMASGKAPGTYPRVASQPHPRAWGGGWGGCSHLGGGAGQRASSHGKAGSNGTLHDRAGQSLPRPSSDRTPVQGRGRGTPSSWSAKAHSSEGTLISKSLHCS